MVIYFECHDLMIGFADIEGGGDGCTIKFCDCLLRIINSSRRLNFKLMALLLQGEFLRSHCTRLPIHSRSSFPILILCRVEKDSTSNKYYSFNLTIHFLLNLCFATRLFYIEVKIKFFINFIGEF